MATTTQADFGAAAAPALRRTATEASTVPSTANASPIDSPNRSPSVTSLSSLASDSLPLDKSSSAEPKPEGYRLLDTYGNEFTPPDFTIKELRDAIPKHCFQRSWVRGFGYIARDMALLAGTFYAFNTYNTPEFVPSTAVRAGLWGVYSAMQGLFGTGLWVIAHECGHGAFSEHTWLNNLTGWVLHSSLLVPYFSWQISHSKHHKATGNMERDMVFVPKTREVYASRVRKMAHELAELTEEAPISTLLYLVGQQLIGWPNYLLTNVTGHNHHEGQREGRGRSKKNGLLQGVNHFNPSSPLYEARDAKYIALSDLGIGLAVVGLTFLTRAYGWQNMLVWYGLPYLWVNHWLVAITFLQHTDPTLPHYTADQWNFVRGAAATIDREMGFIGRHLLHGIIETHVLHHYDSKIPFYHADEASEAIKKVMGRHYRADVKDGPVGFIRALYRSARWCNWVEPSEGAVGGDRGILFFRNRNGLGTKPAKVVQ
jgi:omega-6 fatty acid desaturase (delta-12 desaturase)